MILVRIIVGTVFLSEGIQKLLSSTHQECASRCVLA